MTKMANPSSTENDLVSSRLDEVVGLEPSGANILRMDEAIALSSSNEKIDWDSVIPSIEDVQKDFTAQMVIDFEGKETKESTALDEVMSIITGGMSLEEAKQARDETVEGYKALPSDIVLSTKAGMRFFAQLTKEDPLAFEMYKTNRQRQEAIKEASGLLRVVDRGFDAAFGRRVGAVIGGVSGLFTGRSPKEVAQLSAKGFLLPDEFSTGYIASKRVELKTEGLTTEQIEANRNFLIATSAVEGFIGDIISLEVGVGNFGKRMSALYKQRQMELIDNELGRYVDSSARKLHGYLKKKSYFIKEKFPTDESEFAFAKALVEQNLLKNPKFGEFMLNRYNPSRVLFTRFIYNEAGELGWAPEASHFKSNLKAVAFARFQKQNKASEYVKTLLAAGLSPEELEYSGVIKWLKTKGEKTVTRDDVVKYIEKNKVKVEIKEYGGEEKSVVEKQIAELDTMKEENKISLRDYYAEMSVISDKLSKSTRYRQWMTPWGEKYKETVIILPPKKLPKKNWTPADEGIDAAGGTPTGITFLDPHFNIEGVVVNHITDQREDDKRQKGTFVQEIQSKWHKEGKEVGYGVTEFDNIPDAPFKESWHMLAFKDILLKAIERGDYFVAFPSGQMIANRYKLSKHLNKISYIEYDNGTILLFGYSKRGKLIYEETINDTEKDLSKIIGKELTKKLLEQERRFENNAEIKGRTQHVRSLEGVDLDIGGDWAKRFYDKYLIFDVNNYIKKWGGKIVDINVGGFKKRDLEGSLKGFYITPQMKKEVLEIGQPLFGNRLAGGLEKLFSERGMAGISEDPQLPEDMEPMPEIFNNIQKEDALSEQSVRQVVENLGGTFKAITTGESSLYEDAPTIYFDDVRGSTRTVRLDKNYEKVIQDKIEESRNILKGHVETAIKKIREVVKKAKPVRKKQEQLYSAERSKRVAKAMAVSKGKIGEEAYKARLSQLTGEMPKVEFESIMKDITQKDIDNLFQYIFVSPKLQFFQQMTAVNALKKLFAPEGFAVPTNSELILLRDVFGDEFVQDLLDLRPFWEKFANVLTNLINVPRAMMASFDLSAPGRQGIVFIGTMEYWKSFVNMFKVMKSDELFKSMMAEIKARPTYEFMDKSGLSLTDMGKILETREEAYMSSYAEKIPLVGEGIKFSERAYIGFLNKLRADMFDRFFNDAADLGLEPEENTDFLKYLSTFINAATGRGPMGRAAKASVFLNNLFFSPKLISSRLYFLNPVTYVQMPSYIRKVALQSLFKFVGIMSSVVAAFVAMGGTVSLDPRSADFMKVKFGRTRIDPWGGFQQYIRAFAQLATGKYISSTTGKLMTLGEGYKPLTRYDILRRQIENKLSPVASLILAMLIGQDFSGKKISIPKEIGKRFVPMLVQDLYDILQDDPSLLPLIVLDTFGFGVQTYGKPNKTKPRVSSTKRSSK